MAEDDRTAASTPVSRETSVTALPRATTPTRRLVAASRSASPGRRAHTPGTPVPAPVVAAASPPQPRAAANSADPAAAADLGAEHKGAAGAGASRPAHPASMQHFDGVQSRPQRGRRRTEKFPIKTVIAAVVMFAFGTLFLILGLQTIRQDKERGIAMIVIGSLTFIPGSYASYNLYGAWKRWPGFKYAHIPSYDE